MSVPKRYNHLPALIVLLLSATAYFILLQFTEGVHGGADSYNRFTIAQYAFEYPEKFLDHWGKPVYILLAAPFAQFGLKAVMAFVGIVSLISGWFGYLIVRRYHRNYAWLVIPLLVFAPAVFRLSFSVTTEPLFACFLIVATWLLLNKRFLAAAILLSFLPLIRTEGLFLLPVFGWSLLLLKQWKTLPFLATGLLLYSLIGAFVFGDFLWLWTQMPYTPVSIYGGGELTFYLQQLPVALGIPGMILLLIGWLWSLFGWFQKRYDRSQHYGLMILIGCTLLYLGFHSVMVWKGWGGALGLPRLIVGVLPLLIIVGWIGVLDLADHVKQRIVKAVTLFTLAATALVFYFLEPFVVPYYLMPEAAEMKKASDWMIENGLQDKRWHAYSPLPAHFGNKDVFDQWSFSRCYGDLNFDAGSYVIWDGHFGPLEGNTPLDSVLYHPYLEQIHRIDPNPKFQAVEGVPYHIRIFKVLKEPRRVGRFYTHVHEDYEDANLPAGHKPHMLTNGAYTLNPANPYSCIYEKPLAEALNSQVDSIVYEIEAQFEDTASIRHFSVVYTLIDSTGETVLYERDFRSAYPSDTQVFKMRKGFALTARDPSLKLKVYAWNAGEAAVLLRDFRVVYFGVLGE